MLLVAALCAPVSEALAQTQETAQPQTQVGGYASAFFLKGPPDSAYERGSFEGLDAGIVLFGELPPIFLFKLEARFKGAADPELEEAWIGLSPSAALTLKLGEYLVPFGRYNEANRPHQTWLVHAPLILESAYPASWRDLGIAASGRIGFLKYSAFFGNGLSEAETLASGQQFRDNNANKGWGARLGLVPGQTMEVGGSFYRGTYDEEDGRSLQLLGGDALWSTENYQVMAEYVRAECENPAPLAKGIVEGYYVQVVMSYGGFWPVASFQKVRHEDAFHGPGFSGALGPGSGLHYKKSRWALGLCYLASSNIRLKVEYDFNREQAPSATLKDDLWTVQATVHF